MLVWSYWKVWVINCDDFLAFLTYNCNEVDKGVETEVVDIMVDSIEVL